MEQLTETSVIFIIVRRLTRWFKVSVTFRFMCIILDWCRSSQTNRFILWYLGRTSSLKYSAIYRICSKIFRAFDRLWDKLYEFTVRCGNSSLLISFIRGNFSGSGSFGAFSLIILFFSIGFGATNLILGTFSIMKAAFTVMGVLASLLLLPGRKRWKACLESSMFWQFVQYIFD